MKRILLSSLVALGVFANAQCGPITSFPSTEGFEETTGGNLPTCWTSIHSAGVNDWNIWTADGSFGTAAGTKVLNAGFSSGSTGDAWVFTRAFTFTGGKQYKVEFVSLANNSTNNMVLTLAYGPNAASAGMITIGADSTNTPTHENQSFTFTPASTGTYYLALHINNPSATTQNSILVDDITVSDNTLAVSDLNANSKISVYPNPVKDILKISDVKGIKSISVSDFSGRLVKSVAPSSEINFSGLKTGNYIVSLIMENGNIQTINIIKK